MAFAPLLSAAADPKKDPKVFEKLRWPLLGSPKLDGIRTIVREQECMSRKLLRLPRPHVHEVFGHLEHMDGEIILGNVTDHDVYNRTQSYVMSKDEREKQDIYFYVFDWAEETWAGRPFAERLDHLDGYVQRYTSIDPSLNLVLVQQRVLNSLEEMLAFEEEMLALGYEGIMLRSLGGKYKHGRSTFKEHTLIKLKRFQDDEFEVTGFIEQMRNENEAKKDELGHTKRSTDAEGMVPAGTLGKFRGRFINGDFAGVEMDIPPGVLKKGERQYIWDHQDEFMSKIGKARHFPHGSKNKPRLPRFVGWRSKEDM